MKRFALWLTIVSMFSLPGLLFAQATGGSTCSAVKEGAGKTTGKKKTRERKVVGKKGASKTKTGGNTRVDACTGRKKVDEPDTGKKKN